MLIKPIVGTEKLASLLLGDAGDANLYGGHNLMKLAHQTVIGDYIIDNRLAAMLRQS